MSDFYRAERPLIRNFSIAAAGLTYFVGLTLIPFNGVPGPAVLGEMRNELSVIPFALSIVLCVPTLKNHVARPAARTLILIAFAALCFVMLSLIGNIDSIVNGSFHDRGGLIKFVTTASVIAYGFLLAGCTLLVIADDDSLVARGVYVSTVVAAIYCVFEFAALHGIGSGPFHMIDDVVHGGFSDTVLPWNGASNLKVTEAWDSRLRSVCFEPPAFGNYCGFAYPWIAYGALRTDGRERVFALLFLVIFSILIIAAQARTGWMMLGATVATMVILRFVYLPAATSPALSVCRLFIPPLILVTLFSVFMLGAYDYQRIVEGVIAGTSTSNLSRLAAQVAALKMFADHPLFGVGLGQFAFYEGEYLPTWGYLSDELWPSLVYPEAPWPAVYSIYPRIAAECGIGAVLAWVFLWGVLLAKIVGAGRALARRNMVNTMCYPTASTCICVLVSGATTDTFRTPMVWIGLATALRYLEIANRRVRSSPI